MSIKQDNKFWMLLDIYGQNYFGDEYDSSNLIHRMYRDKFEQSRQQLIDYIDQLMENKFNEVIKNFSKIEN